MNITFEYLARLEREDIPVEPSKQTHQEQLRANQIYTQILQEQQQQRVGKEKEWLRSVSP